MHSTTVESLIAEHRSLTCWRSAFRFKTSNGVVDLLQATGSTGTPLRGLPFRPTRYPRGTTYLFDPAKYSRSKYAQAILRDVSSSIGDCSMYCCWENLHLTLASLLILCDVPLVNLLHPMGWAILRQNPCQRLAQKWNSSNDKMNVLILLLTAWIPRTWGNKNRATLAISTATTLSYYVLQGITRVAYAHSLPAQNVVVPCICAIIISLATGISAINPVFHRTIILVST